MTTECNNKRKKIATFRTMKNVDENKDEIKTLQNFLTKYTKSAKNQIYCYD